MTETTTGAPARALPAQFGPKPGWLRKDAVKRQLETLVSRLVLRAQAMDMPLYEPGVTIIESMASTLILMLDSPMPAARQVAARRIGESLLDVGEREAPDFWVTDLGRALAREIGYISPWVPHAVAQAVLQVSRQAIDQMAAKGRLDMQARLIDRKSLQAAAAERWPREADR